jgi:hypothetical protein
MWFVYYETEQGPLNAIEATTREEAESKLPSFTNTYGCTANSVEEAIQKAKDAKFEYCCSEHLKSQLEIYNVLKEIAKTVVAGSGYRNVETKY